MKGIVNMGKIKELKYYDVQKVGTIKELLEIAVEQAGDKIAFKYKDEKGKEVDEQNIDKPMLIPKQAYQDIIDLYLDEDEWGDMTSIKNGYDLKLTRSGKGQMDTTYTISPCQKKPLDKKYAKPVNLEEMVRKHILPYDELEDKLNEFLCGGVDDDDDDEDDTPKKKKKSLKDKDKKKKKKAKGLDI